METQPYKNEKEWKDHYMAVRKRIADAANYVVNKKMAEENIRAEEERAREAERSAKELEVLIEYSKNMSPSHKLLIAVAREHGFTPGDIRGTSRARPLVAARQEFCYRARAELRWSLNQIGMLLNRDHTTILHGILTHAKRKGLEVPKVE